MQGFLSGYATPPEPGGVTGGCQGFARSSLVLGASCGQDWFLVFLPDFLRSEASAHTSIKECVDRVAA
jgi:hypothetical protein